MLTPPPSTRRKPGEDLLTPPSHTARKRFGERQEVLDTPPSRNIHRTLQEGALLHLRKKLITQVWNSFKKVLWNIMIFLKLKIDWAIEVFTIWGSVVGSLWLGACIYKLSNILLPLPRYLYFQRCGSGTFWCGSGFADPDSRIRILFISSVANKLPTKVGFFPRFFAYWRYIYISIKS